MREIRLATQLFLGADELRGRSLREISRSISRAKELSGLDALMIWSGIDPDLYGPLVEACRDCGVAPFLWFAVLADAQGVSVGRDDLLLLHDGSRGQGSSGAWKGLGQGEEQFLFCCPNRGRNVRRVLEAFAGLLDRFEFAGVMLDRIRYPSAVNGLESLFGCFCPECREEFRRLLDGPADALEEQRRKAEAFLARPEWSVGARSFEGLWAEAGLAELFAFKARSVARVVERFAAEARSRGLEVGLDLYSPSLAATVSQDYALLSRFCDWLKPMIYCRAVGPAGLPLELACLQRGLRAACRSLSPGRVGELLRSLLPWEWPETEASLLAEGLPETTLATELARIPAESLSPGVRVLAGVEAIRNPAFRVDVSSEALKGSLALLTGRADGLVASWNLLYIPEDNLRAIAAFLDQG